MTPQTNALMEQDQSAGLPIAPERWRNLALNLETSLAETCKGKGIFLVTFKGKGIFLVTFKGWWADWRKSGPTPTSRRAWPR